MCSLFWGLFLLAMGASIIVNVIFGISIPVLKIFIAGFLIYVGIKMLMPASYKKEWRCFYSCNNNKYALEESIDGDRYTVRFGTSTVDLISLAPITEPKTITVSSQFANVTVILPAQVPVRVKSNISFGSVQMPNNTAGSEYVNLHGAATPVLTVFIDSSFSSVSVKE